jgi:hypothetical protein
MIADGIKGRLKDSNSDFGGGATGLKDAVAEVLPKVKEVIKHVGRPDRSTPQLGLGHSPGGTGGDSVHPPKKPEHVSSTEPGFEKSITDLINYHQRNAEGTKP